MTMDRNPDTALDAPAMKFIRQLALQTVEPEFLEVGQPCDQLIYFNPLREQMETFDLGPPHRDYQLHNVRDFADAINHFDDDGKAMVFVGDDECVCLLDEKADRRHCLRLPLLPSRPFKLLMGLELTERSMRQRELVDMLRIHFGGHLTPDNVLSRLRNLKINKKEDGTVNISTGGESFSRRLEAEISGDGEPLPDNFGISLQVFERYDAISTVNCALSPNLADSTFKVVPLAGEVERVRGSILQMIIGDLRGLLGDVSIFHGVPRFETWKPRS
jgi:hypothetical protein